MFGRMLLVATSSVTTGAVAVAASPTNPYAWVGDWMPMVIGIIMVILVRAILDMNASKKRTWNYNALVVLLCSIFCAVFVREYHMSAGQACLFGMGIGGTGIGIISFGKPVLLAIVGKASDALKATAPTDAKDDASKTE